MADPFSFAIATVAQIGISYLFPSEGPRMKDLRISASTYGASIPETFGVTRVAGNLIWSTPIKEHKRETAVGKGGMSFYNKYTYTCSFAMAFCKGPVADFRKLWANGKLIYDVTGTGDTNNAKYNFRIYPGSEAQYPDSAIVADKGDGNTPAYRGLCYIVFDDIPLEDFGNQLPQLTGEVYRDGVATEVAPKIDLQIGSGSAPGGTGGSFQIDQQAVDYNRGYIYLTNLVGDRQGIRRINIETGAEDLYATNGMFQFPDTTIYVPPINFKYDNQQLAGLLCVDPNSGYILVGHGFNNNWALDLLDPDSFCAIATYGHSSPAFPGDFIPGGFGPGQSCVSTSANGETLAYYRSIFGQVYEFSMNPANFTGGQIGQAGTNIAAGVICAANNLGSPKVFWAYDNQDSEQASAVLVGGGAGFSIPNPSSGDTFSVRWINYDETDPGLLVCCVSGLQSYFVKYSFATESVTWTKFASIEAAGVYGRGGIFTSGVYAWVSTSKVWAINTITGDWVTGEALRGIDPLDQDTDYVLGDDSSYTGIPILNDPGHFTSTDLQFWDPIRKHIITIGAQPGNPQIVSLSRAPVEETDLATVVSAILREGGMIDAQMDMTRLAGVPIYGYGWARGVDIKAVLDDLRKVYLFDIVESDGKLVGVMRGDGFDDVTPGAVAEIIPQDALGSSSPDATDFWQQTRTQEADLPERVSLSYMNFANDYQEAVARSTRISNPIPTMYSRQQVAIEVTVVMTPEEAKYRANRALYVQWAERTKHDTRLPWAYLDLDPTDLITVDMNDGRSFLDRLHLTEVGADLTMRVEAYSQDPGAYDTAVPVSDGGGDGRSQFIASPKAAKPIILNTPLLRDSDDTGGSYSLYYAGVAHGASGDFKGGALFRGLDGVSYDLIYNTDNDVEWGAVGGITPPPSRGNFALDWETKLVVWPSVSWFDLDSITDDELWAGGNMCVVGGEVMQFRDCVKNVDGSWTLWNLLRARRGTDYAAETHKAGESFIFLSTGTLSKQGDVLDSAGQRRFFKAVGEGGSLNSAVASTIVYQPRDLMPYAPSDIRRTLNVDGSITVEWKRRTRFGGNMQDFVGSVPLNESAEAYEVYLLKETFDGDPSSPSPPQQSIHFESLTASTLTWMPQDTAQFDANLDSLTVVVYQVSAAVGRGFPGVRSIEPWNDF